MCGPRRPPTLPREEPFAAWVVRATSPEVLAGFRASAIVGVPAGLGSPRPTPKQRRQLERVRSGARVGDRVVVPDDGDLHCGVLVGLPLDRAVAGVGYLTRRVRWEATVPRSALRRPYQLQDPQLAFALRGEPAVGR